MTDNMIVVSDLKKSFKINRVLRNVTFTVRNIFRIRHLKSKYV